MSVLIIAVDENVKQLVMRMRFRTVNRCETINPRSAELETQLVDGVYDKKPSVYIHIIHVPIRSIYGIFTYYHKCMPNVGKYTIHGSYGVSNPKGGNLGLNVLWILRH